MKIVLCGSMSAAKTMVDLAKQLESNGHVVTLPSNIDSHVANHELIEQLQEKIEFDVLRYYYGKIEEGDAILVVNIPKNGVENYIGGNSLIEMAFAHVLGKAVYILHRIPECAYIDEIIACRPIELDGNIDEL